MVDAYGRMLTAVVVAMMLPTVSCVPVAISCEPFELETTIEFSEKKLEPVPPFAIVFENVDKQFPETAKHPPERFTPTLDVEVACPIIFNPLIVVVPNPLPEISKAEIDVVAVPAIVVVER